jgi:hypothetical protein
MKDFFIAISVLLGAMLTIVGIDAYVFFNEVASRR